MCNPWRMSLTLITFLREQILKLTYPAAQDPEVVPPFDSHSLDVKQVPFLKRLPVPPLKEKVDFLRKKKSLSYR